MVPPSSEYPSPIDLEGPLSPWLHDPGWTKGPEGYILVSSGVGLPIRTSKDRIHWAAAGLAFPDGAPAGTDRFTGVPDGNLWAPDITYVNGSYWLYYSASRMGSQTSGIFLARSESGKAGSWVDHGLVISTTPASSFNAIDPNLAISDGKWWLDLGSYWSGIKLLPLDFATGLASGEPMLSLSKRSEENGSEEAPFLFHHGSFWYLFTSWGSCCDGRESTYSIHVSRSRAITGPFVDKDGVPALEGGGSQILGTHGTIYGPGGQSVLQDADDPVLVYHFSAEEPHQYHIAINRLTFKTGWPVVI